jgi:hypothetical protein
MGTLICGRGYNYDWQVAPDDPSIVKYTAAPVSCFMCIALEKDLP